MSWSRIKAIYRKDMRDAFRDSRVLTALLMPLALGLIYSVMFSDESTKTQKVKVGIVSSAPSQLTSVLPRQAGRTVRLTFVPMRSSVELDAQVQRKEVDIGLVVPPGFDADVSGDRSPTLIAVLPSAPSFSGDVAVALLNRSVEAMAGHSPPAHIQQRSLPPASGVSTVLEVLGARKGTILVAMIMLLTMIAVYAVPTVLVEETEKRTIDALTLIASTADVIIAKALFGVALSLVTVPLLLLVTRARPAEVADLAAVVVVTAVVLVGIGLLTTRVLRTQQQINTWSGLILLALLAPAFTVGLSAPDLVNRLLWFFPTGHSFRLIANAFAGRTLYPGEWLSLGMLLAWAVVAYGILWWRLARRETV
jgi:ABC-2 type transport system permease protein